MHLKDKHCHLEVLYPVNYSMYSVSKIKRNTLSNCPAGKRGLEKHLLKYTFQNAHFKQFQCAFQKNAF